MTVVFDGPGGSATTRTPLSRVLTGYLALTKPRIVELLLVTTVPAMVLAARGLPSLPITLATVVGGAAAAGSANAFNCYLDRDIDAVMVRTAHRPLSRATVSPRGALVFAVFLAAAALALLWAFTDPLATWLTVAAITMYVIGYTLLLKRRTPENIVWGGAAGCMPTLIGWAAIRDDLGWAPVLLFAIVFFWTPPHFWALAMRFRRDYAAAGVPMLPVVADDAVVVRRIGLYTALTATVSLALWPVAGLGPVYGLSALVLNGLFGREARLLHRRVAAGEQARPLRLFHWSITYLTLLFLAVGVDVLVRNWR
jgi:protoheme IX farnesyltransferase